MKIVRPYGQSKTDEEGIRYIDVRTNDNKTSYERQEFSAFNEGDPRILIAQWISIIDKIITKPTQKDLDKRDENWRRKNPTKNDDRRKLQLDTRTKLGAACWELLKPRLNKKEQEAFERIWQWKLHPVSDNSAQLYSDKPKRDKNGRIQKEKRKDGNGNIVKNKRGKPIYTPVPNENYTLPIHGRWFQNFAGENSLETYTDLRSFPIADLAKSIEEHLHGKERKIHNGERAQGLIQGRAGSIAENSLTLRMRDKIVAVKSEAPDDPVSWVQLAREITRPAWTEEDETLFSQAGDLAKQIFDRNEELEKVRKRIYRQEAADFVFNHYGTQFGPGGAVPTRQEIIAAGKESLLALYDTVRTYYRTFLTNTQKGQFKKSKLSVVLPKDNGALFNLIRNRHNNSVTNDLIRLGKVMHYESTLDDGDAHGFTGEQWKANFQKPLEDIAQSRYWTSDGQSEIKRTESFVRVWRNLLSQAARTARALADPSGEARDEDGRPADVLTQSISRKLAESDGVKKHAPEFTKLLFGKEAELFTNDINPADFTYAVLRVLGNVRNKAFHFKGRRTFVASVKNGEYQNTIKRNDDGGHEKMWKAMACLLQNDLDARNENRIDTFKGAFIHHFANSDEFADFVNLMTDDTSDVTLPKFNAILLRVENTSPLKINENPAFPPPASAVQLGDDPAHLAKFIALKSLYEGPFRNAVQKIKPAKLQGYCDAAKKLGTIAAKNINGRHIYKNLILAKTENLPNVSHDDTIATYMNKLQAEQASEMRIQKGYDSDSAEAKKQSEWIENFRKDIVARAFCDYLIVHKNKLAWLLTLKPGDTPGEEAETKEATPALAAEFNENWHRAIYFLLHLVPSHEASRFLHQLRKWGVLEANAASDPTGEEEDGDVEELKRLLVLYLEMSNAKHDGAAIDIGLEPFKDMYEEEAAFDRVFKTEAAKDGEDGLGATRRALREIMRYGHMKVLSAAIKANKVTHVEIDSLVDLEVPQNGNERSEIAWAQLQRKNLHKEITKQRGNPSNTDLDTYKGYLNTIKKHKKLSSRVKLTDVTRLHRVMVRVVARLIDYGGIWERDGYFISLALMRATGKMPGEVFNKTSVKDFRIKGQLPKFEEIIDRAFKAQLMRYYTPEKKQVRNDLHHFNLIAGDDVNLTQSINDVRGLLAYDRKLKNAVAKSITDLIYEEGILIKWSIHSHELELAKDKGISTRTITHLKRKGDDNFKDSFHGDEFQDMVRQIFVDNSDGA